jgi:hypothetical protein
MNPILIPLAMVVLVAGCAMPNLFGQQAGQPVVADTAQTVVVREIYHETPIVYVDTVYMAAEPEPVQPVYVQNEYNEYNKTTVYVRENVVLPPPRPYIQERGRSPRDNERRPADRRRDDRSGRNKPGGSDKPGSVNPQHPVTKMDVPAANDRQQAPVPPTAPAVPKRQAPVGSAQVTQVQKETPKQAPTPSVDKPATSASNGAPVSLAQAVRK